MFLYCIYQYITNVYKWFSYGNNHSSSLIIITINIFKKSASESRFTIGRTDEPSHYRQQVVKLRLIS